MFARRHQGREIGLSRDVSRRTTTAVVAALVGSLLSVPLTLSLATPAQAVDPGGLVFDFDLGDPNGFASSQMRDLSGNNRHATLQSGATRSSDGSAINFASGWADITSDLPASITWAGGVGISFFANFGGAETFERIIDIGNGSNSSNIVVARNSTSTTLNFTLVGASSTVQCFADGILNNTWAHYAISYNGSSCTWYRNGVALVTTTGGTMGTQAQAIARTNAWIGRSNWGGGDALFSGSISALSLYNRALSATEVSTNYSMQSCLGSSSTTSGGFTYVAMRLVASCTWTAPPGLTAIDLLIVGGGGGGGVRHAGGGGGGGVLRVDGRNIAAGSSLSVTVGGGGAGRLGTSGTGSGSNGSSSSVTISGTTLTAVGGGAGGTGAPGNGGSGGGGYNVAGTGTTGQGNSGGTGGFVSSGTSFYFSGGGGGAGAAGSNGTSAGGGKGGDGVGWFASFTSSVATTLGLATNQFGGGGGGGIIGEDRVNYPRSGGAGGAGGGGAGGGNQVFASAGPAGDTGVSGTANTGGGGGGSGLYTSGSANPNGGNGGSGVVLIRYQQIRVSLDPNGPGTTGTNEVLLSPAGSTSVVLPNADRFTAPTATGFADGSTNTPRGTGNREFVGWNTQANGSGTWFQPGDTYTGSDNVTLFAIWNCGIKATSGDYTQFVIQSTGVASLTCRWFAPRGVTAVEVLIVGGGGGGGFGSLGGGGGAGEVLVTNDKTPITVTPLSATSVTIGAGGTSGTSSTSPTDASGTWTRGGDGTSSSFGGFTARGGGGGGGTNPAINGSNGGSGGGSAIDGTRGNGVTQTLTGWTSYANSGGLGFSANGGGGGGGAGGAGTSASGGAAGRGGPGRAIFGLTVAGGGGGWASGLGGQNSATDVTLGGNARLSTGGYPMRSTTVNGLTVYNSPGTNGTGSGGGAGAQGGSGLVVVRYTTGPGAPVITGITPTVNTASLTFTAPTHVPTAIARYEYSIDTGTTWVQLPNLNTTQTITGLKPLVQYNLIMRAVSTSGGVVNGVSSEPFTFTTASGLDSSLLIHYNSSTKASFDTATSTSLKDLTRASVVLDATASGAMTSNSVSALTFNRDRHLTLPTFTADFTNGITVDFEGDLGAADQWERIIDFSTGVGAANNILVARPEQRDRIAIEIYQGSTSSGVCTTTSGSISGFARWTLTLDGSTCRIWRNGIAQNVGIGVASTATGTSATYTGLPVTVSRTSNFIGRSNFAADAMFEGSIRSLRVYNQAYTPAQIGASTLEVTLNTQGGQAMPTQYVTVGQQMPDPGVPVRTGYIFQGWATQATNGTALEFPYTFANTSNFTLFANWIEGAPQITSQPVNTTVSEGGRLNLNVVATAPVGVVISYQWQKLGQNSVWTSITGATSETFTVNVVAPSDAGSYRVVVTNVAAGASTNSDTATVTVLLAQAPVTITADRALVYGSTVTVTASGGQAGLTFGSFSVTGSCTISGSVITATGMNPCVVSVTKQGNSTYAPATGTVTLSVGKASLRITPEAKSVQYGATAASLTYQVSGLVFSDTAATMVQAVNLSRTAGNNAGTYTISVVSGSTSLTATGAQRYELVVSDTATYTITARPITIKANNASRNYLQPNPDFSYTITSGSLVAGDVIGGFTYSTADSSAPVGTYTITPSNAVFSAGLVSNYAFTYLTGTLTINKINQSSISFTNSNTVRYGDTLQLTLSTSQSSGADSFTVSSGSCTISGSTLTARGVGTCSLIGTRLGDSNYNSASTSAFDISVTARPLVITADNKSITFGSAAPTITVTATGLAFSDSVTSFDRTFSGTNSATAPTNAGSYSITPSNAVISSGNANYSITYAAGSFTIAKATPVITINSAPLSATFGQSAPALPSATATSGAVASWSSSDVSVATVSGTTITLVGSGTTTLRVTFAATANYESATTSVQLTVAAGTQAPVTYSGPTTTVYGTAIGLTLTGGSGAGAITWSRVSGPCSVSGAVMTPTGATTAGNLCVIRGTKLGGAQYVDATTGDVSISISKKALTVTPTSVTRTKDSISGVQFSYTASGLVGADTATVTYKFTGISPTIYTTSTTVPTDLGSYEIAINSIDLGGAAGNYTLTLGTGTYVITKATPVLTVAQNADRTATYLADTTVTFPVVTSSATGVNAGAITYASSNPAVAVVNDPSSPVMTIIGAGTANLIATQAETEFFRAVSVTMSLTVSKASQGAQASLTVNVPTTLRYGDTGSIAARGGAGTGNYTYAVTNGSGACTLVGTTIRGIKVGECYVTPTRLGDANYLDLVGVTETITVTARELTISVSSVDHTFNTQAGPAPALQTAGLAVGDSVTGISISWTIDTVTTTSAPSNAGTYTLTLSGAQFSSTNGGTSASIEANYTITYATGLTYIISPAVPSLAWGSGTTEQIARRVGASNFTMTTTSSPSDGEITFASSNAAVATVNATTGVVTVLKAGVTTITATQAATQNYVSSTISAVLTVTKSAQAPLDITSSSQLQYGNTLTLTAQGGSSGGPVLFTIDASDTSGLCSVTGSSLVASSTGSCIVKAQIAEDDAYFAVSDTMTVTVTPRPITVSMENLSRNYTGTAVSPALSPTCSVTGLDVSDTLTCSGLLFIGIANNSEPLNVGTYSVRPDTITVSNSSRYTISVIDATYTINAIAPTFNSNNQWSLADKTFGEAPFAITNLSSNSVAPITYASSNASVVTVDNSTGLLTIIGAGTTTITATQSAFGNYLGDSITATLTVAQAVQAAVVLTSVGPMTYGTGYGLTAAGGSGSGAYGFLVVSASITSNGTCTISGTQLSASGAGSCVIKATRAASTNYLAAESAEYTISVLPAPLSITAADVSITFGQTPSFSFSVSGLVGLDTVTAVSYTYSGSATRPTAVGQYALVPGAATFGVGDSGNYSITYVTGAFTIDRTPLSLTWAGTINKTYGDAAFDLPAPTTNSDAPVTYTSADANKASIEGSKVTINGAGTLTLTATLPATSNVDGGDVTLVLIIAKAAQQALTLATAATQVQYGNQFTITISGGSGVGAVSVNLTGPCATVSSTSSSVTVEATGIGNCAVTAAKAADDNFDAATTAQSLSITIVKRTLTVTVSPASRSFGSANPTFSYSASGLKSGDVISSVGFTADSTDVAPGATTALSAGRYTLGTDASRISLASGTLSNYDVQVVTSNFDITAIAASLGSWSIAAQTYSPEAEVSLTPPSSNSAGSWTYSSDNPAVAQVSGTTLIIKGAGTANIVATQAANGNYAATSSSPTAFVVSRASQASVTIANQTVTYGEDITLAPVGGSGTGSFSYSLQSGNCSASGPTFTAVDMTSCVVRVTRLGDSNFSDSTPVDITISVAKRNLVIRAENKSKIKDGADPVLTAVVTGLALGDSLPTLTYQVGGSPTLPNTSGSSLIDVDPVTNFTRNGAQLVLTDFYTVTYETGTFTVALAAPTVGSSWSIPTVTFGVAAFTPTTAPTSNSAGTWRYSSSDPSVVSVDATGRVLTVLRRGSGTVTITATQDAAGDYTQSVGVATTLRIDKAAQLALEVNAVTGLRHGDQQTLGVTGGSGNGAVEFEVAGGPCTIAGSMLTATGAGDCFVTATKATDDDYLAQNSVQRLITIAPRPVTITVEDLTIVAGEQTAAFTSVLTGEHAGVSIDSITYLIGGAAQVPAVAGTYPVTVDAVSLTGGQPSDYDITFIAGTLTVTSAQQAALIVTGPTTVTAGQVISFAVTGGSGTGDLSLVVVSGTCTVEDFTVRGTQAGQCEIRAEKAGDSVYAVAQSALIAITVTPQPSSSRGVSALQIVTVPGSTLATWDGPANAVLVVRDRNGDEVKIAQTSKNEFDLSALTPGRVYNVTVTGDGSSWTTGFAAPVATPVQIRASAIKQSEMGTEVRIAWEQPGFAVMYRVTITPKGGVPFTVTTKDKDFEITTLPGKDYAITVAAMGEDGSWGTPRTLATRTAGASGTTQTPLSATQLASVRMRTVTAKQVVLATNPQNLGALQVRVTTNGRTQTRTCTQNTCAIPAPTTGLQLITTLVTDAGNGLTKAVPLAALMNVPRTLSTRQRVQLINMAAIGEANGGRITVSGAAARSVVQTLRDAGFSGPITARTTRAGTTTAAWAPR